MPEKQTEGQFTQGGRDSRPGGHSGCGQVAETSFALAKNVYATISDCWKLTKPEVNFLIALTTFTSFYLSNAHQSFRFPLSLLLCTLAGGIPLVT